MWQYLEYWWGGTSEFVQHSGVSRNYVIAFCILCHVNYLEFGSAGTIFTRVGFFGPFAKMLKFFGLLHDVVAFLHFLRILQILRYLKTLEYLYKFCKTLPLICLISILNANYSDCAKYASLRDTERPIPSLCQYYTCTVLYMQSHGSNTENSKQLVRIQHQERTFWRNFHVFHYCSSAKYENNTRNSLLWDWCGRHGLYML